MRIFFPDNRRTSTKLWTSRISLKATICLNCTVAFVVNTMATTLFEYSTKKPENNAAESSTELHYLHSFSQYVK